MMISWIQFLSSLFFWLSYINITKSKESEELEELVLESELSLDKILEEES